MYNRFETQATWEDYDPDSVIMEKALKIKELIPEDVSTILDVGCGNGIITNELVEKWQVIGLDSSKEALKSLQCTTLLSSATEIPVPDRSFDLVLSSEMLEHLNDEDLVKAVNEIKRVSNKYLVISVPNNEYLDASLVKCPVCSNIFHAWHHFQSFSRERLKQLFMPGFLPFHYETMGNHKQKWLPALLKLKHYLGQWMYPDEHTVCPDCGNTAFPRKKGNPATKIINGLNLMLTGKKQYWQLVMYKRHQS
jgi:ubiquinone/menaquinone biosynthesis C-methylase UbiE